MTIYRKYTSWRERIIFKKGETYCPICKGKGSKIKSTIESYSDVECNFCQGSGKSDWIQNITMQPKIENLEDIHFKINLMKNNIERFLRECLKIEANDMIIYHIINGAEKKEKN